MHCSAEATSSQIPPSSLPNSRLSFHGTKRDPDQEIEYQQENSYNSWDLVGEGGILILVKVIATFSCLLMRYFLILYFPMRSLQKLFPPLFGFSYLIIQWHLYWTSFFISDGYFTAWLCPFELWRSLLFSPRKLPRSPQGHCRNQAEANFFFYHSNSNLFHRPTLFHISSNFQIRREQY